MSEIYLAAERLSRAHAENLGAKLFDQPRRSAAQRESAARRRLAELLPPGARIAVDFHGEVSVRIESNVEPLVLWAPPR